MVVATAPTPRLATHTQYPETLHLPPASLFTLNLSSPLRRTPAPPDWPETTANAVRHRADPCPDLQLNIQDVNLNCKSPALSCITIDADGSGSPLCVLKILLDIVQGGARHLWTHPGSF